MSCLISSIHYCPVKSLSYQSLNSCNIKKNLGIINDRAFAFLNLNEETKKINLLR